MRNGERPAAGSANGHLLVPAMCLLLACACSSNNNSEAQPTTTHTRPLATGPEEPSGAVRTIAESFVAFAESPADAPMPPFATPLTLVLGPEQSAVRSIEDPRDPEQWRFNLDEHFFRGMSGTTSPLELVAADGSASFAEGPRIACTGTFPSFDPSYADLTNIVISGTTGTGQFCFESFRVDLFVDPAGEISVVVLDLYDP